MSKYGVANTHIRRFDKSAARDFIADALKHAAAKQIARDSGSSPRNVEKWRGRLVAPSLHHFLNMCQTAPELKAAMRELLGMDGTDATFQRALADFIRAAQGQKP